MLFLKRTGGVTYIEFAISSSVFLLLLYFTFEFMLLIGARSALNTAISQVGRFGINEGNLSQLETNIKQTISDYSLGIIKADDILITVSAYPLLEDASTAPVEPFQDTNNNASIDLNEYWVNLVGSTPAGYEGGDAGGDSDSSDDEGSDGYSGGDSDSSDDEGSDGYASIPTTVQGWDEDLGVSSTFSVKGVAAKVSIQVTWTSFFPILWDEVSMEAVVPVLNIDSLG